MKCPACGKLQPSPEQRRTLHVPEDCCYRCGAPLPVESIPVVQPSPAPTPLPADPGLCTLEAARVAAAAQVLTVFLTTPQVTYRLAEEDRDLYVTARAYLLRQFASREDPPPATPPASLEE